MDRFGSTYLEIKTQSKHALLYNVLYMLRRLLFAVITLLIPDNSVAQIQILIFHCILLIIYNKLVEPFEQKFLNILEIFNELCIIIAAYHLFIFTDYTGDPILQYQLGWSIIGVTVFNISVNVIVMMAVTIKKLKLAFFKYKYKLHQVINSRKPVKKEQIYKENVRTTDDFMFSTGKIEFNQQQINEVVIEDIPANEIIPASGEDHQKYIQVEDKPNGVEILIQEKEIEQETLNDLGGSQNELTQRIVLLRTKRQIQKNRFQSKKTDEQISISSRLIENTNTPRSKSKLEKQAPEKLLIIDEEESISIPYRFEDNEPDNHMREAGFNLQSSLHTNHPFFSQFSEQIKDAQTNKISEDETLKND